MRPVIQSFKKVLNMAVASFTAGFQSEFLAIGVDSVAAGQTTATDHQVPTGSIIKYIEIQLVVANLAAAAGFIDATIQYRLAGQVFINPRFIGGSNQRNQVLKQSLFSVGEGQNSTHVIKFKVPKKFQRIREGMEWALVWGNGSSVTREIQVIYKFYR